MKAFGEWLFNILVVIAFITLFSNFGPYDDTDDPTRAFGDRRSGLGLYIDRLTGCHYLARPFGGLIPRVNGRGEHICRVYDQAYSIKKFEK